MVQVICRLPYLPTYISFAIIRASVLEVCIKLSGLNLYESGLRRYSCEKISFKLNELGEVEQQGKLRKDGNSKKYSLDHA